MAKVRSHTHDHYLKGVVACGHCGRTLLFTPCKGVGGYYDYFVCMGRHREKNCDMPYLPADGVEQFVTDYYESDIEFDAKRIAELKPRLTQQFNEMVGYREQEAVRCEKELAGSVLSDSNS